MNLYTQTYGSGRDIVLVHGWGLSSSVWDETAQALSENFRVTLVDLPGYGRSPLPAGNYSLETLASLALAAAPHEAVWMGWSLGGMVAIQVALRQRQRVTGLILIGSTPRFVHGTDWPCAIDTRVLEEFARDLTDNYRETMKRFLTLQARNSASERVNMRRLNARLFKNGEPAPDALQGGLNILRDTDLRDQLANIIHGALVVAGEHDTLVPLAAAKNLAVMLKSAHLQIIPGAGHAPFLSHPQEFLQAVHEFLHEQSQANHATGAAPAR